MALLFVVTLTLPLLKVCSVALLVFDWFLTLPAEIKYTWKASWNLGQILFFLTRYPAFINITLAVFNRLEYNLSASACSNIDNVRTYVILFGIIVAEVILTLRVWVLWERNRKVGLYLLGISIATTSGGVVSCVLFGSNFNYVAVDTLSPNLSGCFFMSGKTDVLWAFVALIVQQTFIFVMTLVHGIQNFRASYSTSLLRTFYMDGVIYYLALQTLSVINLVVITTKRDSVHLANIMTYLQGVLHPILSARIILHLHEETRVRNSTYSDDLPAPVFRVPIPQQPYYGW